MLSSGPHRFRRFPKYNDAVRSVNAGWIWNAGGRFPTWFTSFPVESIRPVLNIWFGVAFSNTGLPITHTPPGTVIGTPDIQVKLPINCQPPTIRLNTPCVLFSNGLPGPNGSS